MDASQSTVTVVAALADLTPQHHGPGSDAQTRMRRNSLNRCSESEPAQRGGDPHSQVCHRRRVKRPNGVGAMGRT